MENKDTKTIRKYLNLIESIENRLILEKNSNVDLNEESAFVTAARSEKLAAAELESVLKMMKSDAKVSAELTKLGIRNTDELLAALKGNRVTSSIKGAMELNILKSQTGNAKLIDLAAENVAKNQQFLKKYETQIKAGQPQFEAALKQAGYSERAITKIVEKAYLKQTSGIQSTATQAKQSALNQPGIRDRLKDKAYVDGLKAKYKPKTLSQQISDKVKGMDWKKAVGYTLLAGGSIAALWFLFAELGKTDELPEVPPQDFPPCAKSLLTNKQGVIAVSPKGEISIVTKQTGVVAYDGVGGLRFYSNGRVFTADNSKRGTYTCKGTEVAVQEENKNLSEEDVLGMSITWDSKTTPEPGETPAPGTKSTYRNCTDFPYTFGCRSQVIKEVQVCLGMSPKYQTGNFGPITLKELKSKRGEETITKEVYDSIKQSCQTSATRPESQYIEPMPSIKSGQIQQPEIQPKTQPSQPSQPSQLNKDFCVALFKNIDDRDQESGRKTANSTEIQQIKDCLQQYNFLFSGSAKMRRRYGLTMSGGDRGIR
jgi:hypothetical protein